jgi:hypothetical protein
MTEPQPIAYELEDHDAKPPETEAEALARMQREDEEKAKRLGLVKEKGAPAGKKWQDGIGGNSATGSAMRLMEQETRLAERQHRARTATVKAVVVLTLLLVCLAVGGALAADYTGLADLGIFSRSKTEVPPPPAPVAAPPAVRLQVLAVGGQVVPEANPPSETPPGPTVRGPMVQMPDPDEVKRLEKRLESAHRGLDSVQGDLAEKQAQIIAGIKALFGMVPTDRDVPPDRGMWRAPCAMIDLERARAVPRTSANAAAWNIAVQNAQATVNNINAALRHNRGVEKDMLGRVKAAQRKLDEAQRARDALR